MPSLEESGTVSPFSGGRYMVITLAATTTPRSIELRVKELQAADYVTWTLFQKHERDDRRFYDIVVEQIVSEEIVQQALW